MSYFSPHWPLLTLSSADEHFLGILHAGVEDETQSPLHVVFSAWGRERQKHIGPTFLTDWLIITWEARPVLMSNPISKLAKNCSPSSRSHRSEGWGPSYFSERHLRALSTWSGKEAAFSSYTDPRCWGLRVTGEPCWMVNTAAWLARDRFSAAGPGTGLCTVWASGRPCARCRKPSADLCTTASTCEKAHVRDAHVGKTIQQDWNLRGHSRIRGHFTSQTSYSIKSIYWIIK